MGLEFEFLKSLERGDALGTHLGGGEAGGEVGGSGRRSSSAQLEFLLRVLGQDLAEQQGHDFLHSAEIASSCLAVSEARPIQCLKFLDSGVLGARVRRLSTSTPLILRSGLPVVRFLLVQAERNF